MALNYRFDHDCGHSGIGPLIHLPQHQDFIEDSSANNAGDHRVTVIRLSLRFLCPFCANTAGNGVPEVTDNQGVLAILTPTFPWTWSILCICGYGDVTPQDWSQSQGPDGRFRQMAWIPRPCGEIRVMGGLEETTGQGRTEIGVVTGVFCDWKQTAEEPVRSRFAGMLSQLNAAILSGGRAGR